MMTKEEKKKVKFSSKAKVISCNKTAPSSSLEKQKQEMKPLNFEPKPSEKVILQQLEEKSVVLETISLKNFYLVGTVLVKNKDFNKSVRVRYTTDNWASFQDLTAGFISSSGPDVDRFQFKLDILQKFYNFKVQYQDDLKVISSPMSLAILYKVGDEEFWDSNSGKNYNLEYEYGFKMTNSSRLLSPRSILVRKYPSNSPEVVQRDNTMTCSTEYKQTRMDYRVDVLLPSFF
eukprot:TRINITY_DN16514_c0_g1_i1.p1 TRINITY_DN16514_c0_g1~~TRINITY_DN16514_c0_g1_i1.p1  ORF type:complete len:232 (+),score=44.45 TRINITY_DN16514_c0_g1_i1:74-769(+)